jgi:heat shock protein HtpX
MWEAIESNKRRSWMLITIMAVILGLVGASIGSAIYMQIYGQGNDFNRTIDAHSNLDRNSGGLREFHSPPDNAAGAEGYLRAALNPGAAFGAMTAGIIWLIMTLITLTEGDRILLRSAGAHQIQKEDAPRLWNVVEEMTIASRLGNMPRVYIIENESPNAFAVGRSPDKAAVAVTSGLLKRLNRDELQGVIAHEIAHIRNLDVRFMTYAAIMVGSIVLLCDVFIRYLWYGGAYSSRRSSSRGGGGYAQLIIFIVAVLAAVLAPIVANMLYFACSRRREYLADACSAQFTRYPEGLASALEKIAGSGKPAQKPSRTLAPMYIVNPLQSRAAVGLFSTHPPTAQRIQVLRSMGGMAGFADYEKAYREVHGAKSRCLDQRSLSEAESTTAREASAEPVTKLDAVGRAKEVAGILDRMAAIIPIVCGCGVNLKIPAAFASKSVRCPRCSRKHDVPAAAPLQSSAANGTSHSEPQIMTYRRKGAGWESFKCSCGGVIQLSPSFDAESVSCRKCGRHVKIQ